MQGTLRGGAAGRQQWLLQSKATASWTAVNAHVHTYTFAQPLPALPPCPACCSLGLEARKAAIWADVLAAAAGMGGVVPDSTQGDLLEEVSNLVESPTVVLGTFDPAFLALPR